MKIEKKILGKVNKCYATSSTVIDLDRKILLATEGKGPCYMYSGPNFEQSTVWDGPGGTMAIVAIPGKNGDFLAIQNFFPIYQSENAEIVWAQPQKGGKWNVKTILGLPYVHRFSILTAGGVNYFIGATLCTTKQFEDDWSDPGKIYIGIIPDDLSKPIKLKVIKEGLTKNHGFCKTVWNEKMSIMVTCEEGVFVITPPQIQDGEWKIETVLEKSVSDIAVIDIDGDGEDELVTIEPFHGGDFVINKKIGGQYKVVYKYPKEMDFGHVVWGGKLRGIPTIIGGYRSLGKELFYVQCVSTNPLKFKTEIIEAGTGPSNIDVLNGKDRDIIIASNHGIDEAALYFVTN
ncbi:MAG TPA: hypothetical protein VIM70_13790 [Clostridium sp.]|uniref:hypothetical protein n=1 Tax=Clostridium sp. TaxID=1506 RepID=UPI002F9259AF